MARRAQEEDRNDGWKDTYGDMVTLLLCFFVLLYSMSTVDENKWKALVQSFNPNATPAETEIEAGDNDGPFAEDYDDMAGVVDPDTIKKMIEMAEDSMQEMVNQMVEQLYQDMKEYIETTGMNVEIAKGDGYVFLSLSDAVFFDGNDWHLRPDGAAVLDKLVPMLNKSAAAIDEIRIMGHTAQAEPDKPNTIDGDRMLAAQRSAVVTAYLQERVNQVDPARFVSQGYGQHRPVAPNDVEENRVKNRRVEMTITGKDLLNQLGGSLEQYYTMREGGSLKPEEAEDGSGASEAPESSGESQEG